MSGAPRIFFYVQHLLGVGHIARASRIADALIAGGFDLTVASGGVPVPGFPGAGVPVLQLPPVKAGSAGFAGLADENGTHVDDAFRATRRGLLLEAFRSLRPDLLLIEAFPFGRRQMRFELLPLLDEAKRAGTAIACSIRDILQEQRKAGRNEEVAALVERHFDRVLVHGDPSFARLEETFPLTDRIASRVVYTGLVAAPPSPPPSERFEAIVSAGGGAAGRKLLFAAADAIPKTWLEGARCLVIAGPNLPEADAAALRERLAANAVLAKFRSDFPSLLATAGLSVSQAGYNTVCDLLRARCPAVLVPFAEGGETEQTLRTAKLVKLGLASAVAEADVTGETLAAAIAAAPSRTDLPATPLDLDGAAATARILRKVIAERRSA